MNTPRSLNNSGVLISGDQKLKNFLATLETDMKELLPAVITPVLESLLSMYVNKATGQPGAAPITLGNVGTIAGVVAASTVLQHIIALETAPATPAPSPALVASLKPGTTQI